MNYLHTHDIVHRDIKPENILISNIDNLEIKLTDFGFATYHSQQTLKDVLGSPMYMAPEIVNREKYDAKVDCWSAGVVTYVLLTGMTPFTGKTKEEVYDNIKNCEPDFKVEELKVVSKDAKDFMQKLFGSKDPAKRMTASEALQHPWLK